MLTFSVIIPTYNRADSLRAAVCSVLAQTVKDLEVLVCDDGSTDNSKEVIDAIGDTRVRWLDCGRNGRPAIPRNCGIKEAGGEWLAFLDSDDLWQPDKLEKQLAQMQTTKTVASSTNAVIIDVNGNSHKILLPETDNRLISFLELLSGNSIICSSCVIHRTLIKQIIGFPEDSNLKALEDYAFWLRVASLTKIAYLGESLVKYTDAPQTSIRGWRQISWYQQQNLVLGDYSMWALRSFKLANLAIIIPRFIMNCVKERRLKKLEKSGGDKK